MNTLRTSLLALALAGSAAAQTQTVCFTDTIPLQPTNWSGQVSIPKFDPNLGTLQSIAFDLTGNVQGSARAESLDAAPTIVNTSFSANITLTRPDLSVIVVTLPVANFSDSFTAFDGVLDFGGTSGTIHAGINVSDTQSFMSPPPASDLPLFTGAGNILLPVTAQGASLATGAGNLITQFMTDAAATVRVCYTYLPNNPPVIQCPGPIMGSAGVPLSFQLCASDVDPADVVTIDVSGAPAGMTFTPPLPTSGNPVCTTVNWTPTAQQVGNFVLVFTAIDTHQRSATCTVNIAIAECHLVVGNNYGNSYQTIFGHTYNTQLASMRTFYPVTMVDMPTFTWQQLPQTLTLQLLMYNPDMFPANPEQSSRAVRITKTGFGTLHTEYLGNRDGIGLRPEVFWVNGEPRVRFPFTIDGM
jgi:hypothetical protein